MAVEWGVVGSTVLLAVIALGAFALVAFLLWLEYKGRERSKDRKMDPVTKAVLLTLLLWGGLFMAEAVGFFDDGWNREHFYIHLVFLIALVSIFVWAARRLDPLPYAKQRAIVLAHAESEFKAAEYKGEADVRMLGVYKITTEGGERALVGNFLVEVDAGRLMRLFVRINAMTGALLHMQPDPPVSLMNELEGKRLEPKRDEIASQFNNDLREDVEVTNDKVAAR